MSRDSLITRDFADGTYDFRLAWGQLRMLQEECDTGPYLILDKLVSGRWLVDDISRVIRLGLIGGGMTPANALQKVRSYVEDRPPLESLGLAQDILGAGVAGVEEEDIGKKSEAANLSPAEQNPSSQTENSDLPPSTATG